MINVDEYFSLIFQRGTECGLEEIELHMKKESILKIHAFKNEIDDYRVSSENLLSIRGTYDGKTGYSYTENLDDSSIELLINNVIENAINNNDYEPITSEIKDNNYMSNEDIDLQEKMQTVLDMEKIAYKLDNRVKSVNCTYNETKIEIFLKNNKGMDIKDFTNSANISISVVAKENDDVKTGHCLHTGIHFSEMNPTAIVKQAVDDAIGLLQAKSIPSGKKEVILRNNVAASILQSFSKKFSSESVKNSLSLFKGKLGKKVSSGLVTIVDDPLYKDGILARRYDDEGTPTQVKSIISNGILNTIMYNNKNALEANVHSTGNGFKSNHKSSLSVSPTNMYIQRSEKNIKALIQSTNDGIMIIDIQGIHAGLNPISGDFSLAAHGFLIKNGKISHPVNQITVGGNFYKMLQDIVDIGDDLIFTHPNNGCVGSPSLKINSLMIGGL